MLEHLEHVLVVLKHVGEQLSNTHASGEVNEMLQEQRCCTSMLIVVGDDESHLCTVRAGSDTDKLADRDEPLASPFSDRQRHPDVIVEVELGCLPEVV